MYRHWIATDKEKQKRLPARIKTPLDQPEAPLQVWSAYFMSDSLVTGRKFKVFNIIDDYNSFRAHSSLGEISPNEYIEKSKNSLDFLLLTST